MNKSDMFEYIGEGNTLYDKIAGCFPKLNGNFSTANLLNNLKEQYGIDTIVKRTYTENFNFITNNLVNAIKRSESGIFDIITPQQEYDLLLELKSFDGDSYRKYSFKSVEEYVDFAKYRIDDPNTKEIQNVLIKFGISILPEKDRDYIRNVLLETVYMPKIKNFLNGKFSLQKGNLDRNNVSQEFLKQKAFEKEPELMEIEKAYNILKDSKLRKIYDSYLKDYMQKQDEVDKKIALFQKCAAKREIVVTDEIKSSMSPSEKNSAITKKNLLYPILGVPGSKNIKQGTYDWEFKEYTQPQVVLNSEANYSENGIENQKVIAASHGQLRFKRDGKPSAIEELLGVTRIGEDKERTYFVAVPLGTMQQFTKEQEEFYSKIFLSDYYLEPVEKYYNRFAGTVIQKQGKSKIVKETINVIGSDERDALNYAQNNSGKYGSRDTTLEEMCQPHSRIPQKHKVLVEFIKGKNAQKGIQAQIEDRKKADSPDFSDGTGGDYR